MEPPSKHEMQETLPKSLNKMLKKAGAIKGGFPQGRCTAFLGERGGHKSHLAYLHLLNRINNKESGLIISLRDDENMTRNTMNGIYYDFKNRIFGRKDKGVEPSEIKAVEEMEKKGKLEILYFHPGYITAEEFFHRVFIAVQKLKRKCKKITVLFNSLDQLTARFPLCAEKDIFIPGLINFLTAEQITSIFIAVPEEKGQPTEQYGLLPMADLILSFKRKKVKIHKYVEAVLKACENKFKSQSLSFKKMQEEIKQMKDKYIEEVVLEVVRFSGGQRAGACGILELKDKKNTKLADYYDRSGLHFTELSEVDWEYIPK
jgi:KaiC/GvpD/RAD55 family RecA-like ATPase